MLFANKQQDWRQVLVKQLTVKFTICGNSEQDISYLGLAMAHAWKNLDLFEDVHQNVVGGLSEVTTVYRAIFHSAVLSPCFLSSLVKANWF